MSDQGVREIQLSGKQLVFLFMASVVVAVGIFLLGVSVGRGVRTADVGDAGSDVVAAGDPRPPADMPPPTETTPVDLGYHDALQGQTTPAAKPPEPPVPAEDAPAARGAATPAPPPAAPVAAPRTVPDKPATSAQAGRPWAVQVGAFRSRENADRQVTQLKGKGFPAYAGPPGPAGALVKVFVGPYSDRAEADRVAGRLQREQGLRPLVTR